jgi:hypothetical protein
LFRSNEVKLRRFFFHVRFVVLLSDGWSNLVFVFIQLVHCDSNARVALFVEFAESKRFVMHGKFVFQFVVQVRVTVTAEVVQLRE